MGNVASYDNNPITIRKPSPTKGIISNINENLNPTVAFEAILGIISTTPFTMMAIANENIFLPTKAIDTATTEPQTFYNPTTMQHYDHGSKLEQVQTGKYIHLSK